MIKLSNLIYSELKKLKLINDKNLVVLNNQTREDKIKVIKDTKSKIIFLEKIKINSKYYRSEKSKFDNRTTTQKAKNNVANVKTSKGNIKVPKLDNDYRRVKQFNKILKNKEILDFGCAWGGFLKNLKNVKSLNGLEIRENCIEYIKKNIKKINLYQDLNSIDKKFDIITMFHVAEHLPDQINVLRGLKNKLKKNGKIIVEVPHAEDFLILQNELKEFKNWTFRTEHLILHTHNSLRKYLSKAGFKKIDIQFYQRYDFSNHLGWFLKRKPGGHNFYKDIIKKKLNLSYVENIKNLKQTDTLIAIAQNT